jgi:RND family efflux transporter MFP subunit
MIFTPSRTLRRFLSVTAFGLAIILPVAGLVAVQRAETPSSPPPPSPALAVAVQSVEWAEGYALRRVFTGQVEASRTGRLGFERAGLLREIHVKEGELATAGQVLARLDSALLLAQRRELEAALNNAEARLALAEATRRRYQNSVGRGAVTQQALDEARAGARAARAEAELARARIASIDVDIAKTVLHAPFAGTVIRRWVDEGHVLAAGNPVLELQEQATPEIRIGIAGALADTLQPDHDYPLTWRGHAFNARLRAAPPVRALGRRTVDALFVPHEPPARLRPGDLVELELTDWVAQPGLWLPLSALAEGSRGLWNVYIAEPAKDTSAMSLQADHRLTTRPVEILYQEGHRVFVRGPLNGGDLIVATGLQRVVPGQGVRAPPMAADWVTMEGR